VPEVLIPEEGKDGPRTTQLKFYEGGIRRGGLSREETFV